MPRVRRRRRSVAKGRRRDRATSQRPEHIDAAGIGTTRRVVEAEVADPAVPVEVGCDLLGHFAQQADVIRELASVAVEALPVTAVAFLEVGGTGQVAGTLRDVVAARDPGVEGVALVVVDFVEDTAPFGPRAGSSHGARGCSRCRSTRVPRRLSSSRVWPRRDASRSRPWLLRRRISRRSGTLR